MNILPEIKQKLELKLSQDLQQSLQILQMSSTELIHYLTEKYESNPLLNLDFNEELLPVKSKRQDIFLTSGRLIQNNVIKEFKPDFYSRVPVITNIKSIIMEQIPYKNSLTKDELDILEFLIRNLNPHGYLEIEVGDVATLFNMAVEQVLEVLYFLQSLEPKGLGARNLQECLLLQCQNNVLAEGMIQNCLHLIERRNLKKIAHICSVTLAEVEATYDYIASLNPRPLQNIQHSEFLYITPDVTVHKIGQEWEIDLNKKHLPKVTIEELYLNMVQTDHEETRNYIKEQFKEAKVILQGLNQREQTLYRLVDELVKYQEPFFERGITALKPMRLTDIAKVMGLHESTVSRATRGKYIRTTYGTYELATLFTKGILNENGNITSISQIKERIKDLIHTENCTNPYSDQVISELLKEDNINLSRRTVAKYREELNIRSSSKRVKYH